MAVIRLPAAMGGIKEEIRALLEQKAFDRLLPLIQRDGSGVRKLYSFLFDAEPLLRWRGVLGFGVLAEQAPTRVARTVSRLAYALNDEATVCAWSTAPAVAEMAHRNAALTKEVVRIVVHYVEDGEACQSTNRNPVVLCSALWAVGRVGVGQPDLVAEVWPTLVGFAADPLAEVRGHAYWAMGQWGGWWSMGREVPEAGLSDPTPVTIFDPETADMFTLQVKELARRAFAKTIPEAGKE